MKKLSLLLFGLLLVLAAVLVARTAGAASRQPRPEPVPRAALDEAGAVERFAGSLRFATVSHLEGAGTSGGDAASAADAELGRLHEYLVASFPQVHARLAREVVAGQSVLYTWRGTDAALAPVLLTAHLDVVPVEPGTEAQWTHPPFEGRVEGGYVWGRGALDDRFGVVGILEAVETLLAEGHRPRRTVLLGFGHDEEVGGTGARAIAARLAERGVRLEYVLDEGGAVTEGMIPGLGAPVALVGVAEKGYVSLALSTRAAGGHSSMPPRETAVGIVSRAVHRLERDPFPGRLQGATREMFGWLGPEMPLAQRLVFANLWLFRPLVERQLAGSPNTDATLRTTTAATMFEGSVKDNVLPTRARAVVNFRILPGETVGSVTARVRRVVDDARVDVEPLGFGSDPSPVSDAGSQAFRHVARTVREVFPDALVAPYLVLGATDARHYVGLTPHVFRFLPARLDAGLLAGMHGTDERVPVASYLDGVRFYRRLIESGP